MEAYNFPQPKGLFDWLARSLVGSPLEAKKIKPEWRLNASRPVYLLAAARCLGSRAPQEVTERTVIVLDGNRPSKDGLRGYCLPNDHIDAYYVAGKYDDIKKDVTDLKIISPANGKIDNILKAFQLELVVKYEVPELPPTDGDPVKPEIQQARLLPLIRPRFAPCLPLPSDKGEWRCISSRATWQALLSLTKSFGSARPPLVLVTGPPGSGKEAYARAVHFGQRRNSGKDALRTISLAELDVGGLRSRLAGTLPRLQQNKGTLFFDEVDKPLSEVRSSLLRTLEARTYSNSRQLESSCEEVTFVCAAGKQLSELRSLAPADFWTRMEIHVPVQDPLLAASQLDREELLSSFFKFFWWDFASSWAESLLVQKKKEEDWGSYFDKNPDSRKLADNLFRVAIGKWDADNSELVVSEAIDRVAEHLASVLSPHLERRQLSTRALRSVVISVLLGSRSQILAAAINAEKTESQLIEKMKELEKAAVVAIHDAIGTVLQVLPG